MLHAKTPITSLLILVLLAACSFPSQARPVSLTPNGQKKPTPHGPGSPTGVSPSSTPTLAQNDQTGIHKIKHVVIIMQENRSFDSYFGTFPGADGIPMQNGIPTVCVPDPATNQCVKPYHDSNDKNLGGPHGAPNAVGDIDGGKMDGFIKEMRGGKLAACANVNDPACAHTDQMPDVMGYHDQREIPNYWAYASHFVLQDHMFEPNASWSLPEHLFMVSGWSARCTSQDPMR